MFAMRCKQNGIVHLLTKVTRPWINGQAERMNWTILSRDYKIQAASSLMSRDLLL